MRGWIVYDEASLSKNIWFAQSLQTALGEGARVVLEKNLSNELPDYAVLRCMRPELSQKLEKSGVKVFNSAHVSKVCNDKRKTYEFFAPRGVPMLPVYSIPPEYPCVVKAVNGHGGTQVFCVNNASEFKGTAEKSGDYIVQPLADKGKDKRVYVLGNEVIVSVLRTSETDFRSNFSLGGTACVSTLTSEEKAIVSLVLCNMKFDLAGIDIIYDKGVPVLNEIEDVVGTRMIYALTDIDIIDEYANYIKRKMKR